MRSRPTVNWLLVFVPVTFVAAAARAEVVAFIAAALAIVPLAGLIGASTEQLAAHFGPRTGGLLNATFGNVTELIVASLLVAAGQADVAKASLTGSIIGNLLMVLGLSFVAGGIGRSEQRFSARSAAVHSASLLVAIGGLLMPAILLITTPRVTHAQTEVLSVLVAGVLIASYMTTLLFTQLTHSHLFIGGEPAATPRWSRRRATLVLLAAALLVGVESEVLVSSLRPALGVLHLPAMFVGLIVIPLIGNAAEHSSAMVFALRDRMNVTIEIAIGSSTQVALFVAPALVFISLALGHPMDFVFTSFEIATVVVATFIVTVTSMDGRSNWLEGAQLLGTYLVVAAASFFAGG